MLKISLLASAFALALFGAAQAGAPTINASDTLLKIQASPLMQLADSDGDGGNSGGGDSDSDSDSNDSDDDSSDDHGGGASNNDSNDASNGANNDDSNDDSSQTVSGRKKPRIPGGSGCDDAGDIAEHPECSPN